MDRGLPDAEIVQTIFEIAYARPPTARERDLVFDHLQSEQAAGRSRRSAFESFLWSVINSKEFQLNH